ncbi:pyrroline-5-carboxylate reductase family protein [Qipengyuania psychrotolerans]|uniref:Pyrroline-5-carboxylate reductase n=1 Tax=Qipengyuania psychrotolerans TaxID=2867238 RepID=A0ABX8ZGF6_9SPHN|nr:pyrroline-5-carboxylate reductase [Qipengyuania psychrotolerans]QZD88091.1 pyrroline-5-carboxylate reductase [Qipengyuania psychrotolerans]
MHRDVRKWQKTIINSVLIVGCGKMGSALLEQWSKGPEAITVIDPGQNSVPGGASLLADRGALGEERFDCIIVAVKPQMIDDVMPAYKQHLSDDGYVISIAAGYTSARLAQVLHGAPVIRVMPNLPAAIGRGVSGICPAPDVSSAHLQHAQDFMARAGTTVTVQTEEELDHVTAVAGSGPGYVFEIARAYVEVAMEHGFSEEQAREMVLGTMGGAIEMASAQGAPPLEELRNSVTSKGGTTAAGLDALNGDGGLTERLRATLQACFDRAVELR